MVRTAAQSARIAIITYSLSITGILMLFLFVAQPLGMRFDYAKGENLHLIDIILPTFLGYLGAASHFLFNANRGREVGKQNESMLKILVHGPFLIFILSVSALFFTYYLTHRPLDPSEPRIDPLNYSDLSRYLSICLALLAATVSVISSYLFGAPPSGDLKQIARHDRR
jgi:hypothetical protein